MNYRFLDHLGSLRVMTDSQGTVVQELDYDPFGYSIPVVSNPPTDDPYQFISKERDAESLNDHYWFRQFSPRLARWCSADPLGGSVALPQSLNRYSYVVNNPTNLIDPLGLYTMCFAECYITGYSYGGPDAPGLTLNVLCYFSCTEYDDRQFGANSNREPGGPGAPQAQKKPTLYTQEECKKQYEQCLFRKAKFSWKCFGATRLATTGVGAGIGFIAGGPPGAAYGAAFGGLIGTGAGLLGCWTVDDEVRNKCKQEVPCYRGN